MARFFADFQAILAGHQPDWGLAPDEAFIRAFESHISWPVKLTAEFLWAASAGSKAFDNLLQEWMATEQGWAVLRDAPKTWRSLVDRAARTLCYVFANRLLFYESVRAKFDEVEELHVPPQAASADRLYLHFQKLFQLAVAATDNYRTLFYPAEKDWAGPHVFGHEHPVELPQELRMSDRRALDLAVFELLGVTQAAERETLGDELYYETAKHFRQIHIVEVQKQEQRAQAEGRECRTDELAADLWDALPDEHKRPLAQWVAVQVTGGLPINLPEGRPTLPDANDFLDANTVWL